MVASKNGFKFLWRLAVAAGISALIAFPIAILQPQLAFLAIFENASDFPITDSLPALSGGLSHLEVFKVGVDTPAYANRNRSVWITGKSQGINVQYYGDPRYFDSTVLYLWSSDSQFVSFSKRKAGRTTFKLGRLKSSSAWTEVVFAYASYPPPIRLASGDESVCNFRQIDGNTLHIVNRNYSRKPRRFITPDTAYPVRDLMNGFSLLAKNSTLAVINSQPFPVVLRIVDFDRKTTKLLQVRKNSACIYRAFLENSRGPFLAYTSPDEPYYKLFRETERQDLYFLLPKHPKPQKSSPGDV